MIARCISMLVGLALGGCSLLNAPDPKWLDAGPPNDAMGWDGGAPDTGVDGGPQLRETTCNDDVDNDVDGLTDCRDFDCAGHAGCCSDIAPPQETTTWTRPTSGWTVIPTAEMPEWPRTGGGVIESFGTTSDPRAVVRNLCVPMLSGVVLQADLTLSAGSCPGSECYAAIVLSSVNDMAPGSRLLDELAIRLTVPDGTTPALRATRNGELIQQHATGIPSGVPIPVEIQIGPTLDTAGAPAIAATVTAALAAETDGGTGTVTLLEDHVFMLQSELISDAAGCAVSPGLFVAIEGVGAVVRVGPLTRTERQCASPTRFNVPSADGDTLTRDREAAGVAALGFGDWASGGIAQPALVSTATDWHVFVDSTDVEREQDLGIRDLGFAIGHASSMRGDWNTSWVTGTGPKLGDCHPSCVGAAGCDSMCPIRRGYREPSVYPVAASVFAAAYADEDVTDPSRPFDITIAMWNAGPTTAGVAGTIHVAPSDLDCDSLREPSLVPQDASASGWWLFFTCERSTMPPRVEVLRLDDTLAPQLDTRATLLTGVRSPEVLIEHDGETAYYRLWATTGTGSSRAVVLYTGEAAVGVLPELTPYPDNPVLTLSDMPPCPGTRCELLGMSVARDRGRVDTLRYLISWQVDGASGTEYQLVPLEQIWP